MISVGNLAMGGRGKTPVVAHVARLLRDAGERPAILSRGYGRRDDRPGAVVVSDGARVVASVDESGDEPLMLARELPGVAVVVADDRRLAGALAERALGATVHLLDDGFQHLALARDVDMVLIAPEDLTARAIPFGSLREAAAALCAADAVLSDRARPADLPVGPAARRFTVRRTLGAPVALDARPAPEAPGPVVALAGLARPERFVDDLGDAGWAVARAITFPDHHRYTARDLAHVADAVRETGAVAVVTTAKDAVRLPPRLPWPAAVAALEVSVEPADEFRLWLLARLDECRR